MQPLVLALTTTISLAGMFVLGQEGARRLTGEVRSEAGPLAGACVRIKGTKVKTTSDEAGRFELVGQGQRITAWKEGYFIGGALVGDGAISIRLRPLPKEDNPDYQWVDPLPSTDHVGNCGNCHGEITREWQLSGHGRAGTNRRFLNLYAGTDWHGKPNVGWGLLKQHGDGAAVCSACHAPTVPFSHPGYDDFRKLDGVHARGVHCDYCHKIADAPTDKLGLDHGRFAYKLLRPHHGQLFFGPLDDVDRDEDVYAPFYKESRYCASCHEGTVFGVKVYTTYSEWLESPARQQGKQCQTCHMAPTGKLTNIAPNRGGLQRDPLTLASHAMPGATPQMLKNCLRLEVKVKQEGKLLHVEVETVATNVGHRVPTGFVDRNLILLVEPAAADGRLVVPLDGPRLPDLAGTGDPAKGNYAGLPGRFFGRRLVPAEGDGPVPFWVPCKEGDDTRLIPDKPDRAAWTILADQVARVRIRLVYRRFLHAVAVEKSWPDNEILVHERIAELK